MSQDFDMTVNWGSVGEGRAHDSRDELCYLNILREDSTEAYYT